MQPTHCEIKNSKPRSDNTTIADTDEAAGQEGQVTRALNMGQGKEGTQKSTGEDGKNRYEVIQVDVDERLTKRKRAGVKMEERQW